MHGTGIFFIIVHKQEREGSHQDFRVHQIVVLSALERLMSHNMYVATTGVLHRMEIYFGVFLFL